MVQYTELYIRNLTKQKQGSRVSGCVLSAGPSLGFRSGGSISLTQEGSPARLGTLFSPQLGQSRGPVRNKSVGGFRSSYFSSTAPTLPPERMHTPHSFLALSYRPYISCYVLPLFFTRRLSANIAQFGSVNAQTRKETNAIIFAHRIKWARTRFMSSVGVVWRILRDALLHMR